MSGWRGPAEPRGRCAAAMAGPGPARPWGGGGQKQCRAGGLLRSAAAPGPGRGLCQIPAAAAKHESSLGCSVRGRRRRGTAGAAGGEPVRSGRSGGELCWKGLGMARPLLVWGRGGSQGRRCCVGGGFAWRRKLVVVPGVGYLCGSFPSLAVQAVLLKNIT